MIILNPDAEEEPLVAAAGDPAEGPAPVATNLAAIALHPAGTPGEIEALEEAWEELRRRIESAAWADAKTLALSMTSVPGFWSSAAVATTRGRWRAAGPASGRF